MGVRGGGGEVAFYGWQFVVFNLGICVFVMSENGMLTCCIVFWVVDLLLPCCWGVVIRGP